PAYTRGSLGLVPGVAVPLGFIHNQFNCFVAFLPLAVIAVADTDQAIPIGFEQGFRAGLTAQALRTGTHRLLGEDEMNVLLLYCRGAAADTQGQEPCSGRSCCGVAL